MKLKFTPLLFFFLTLFFGFFLPKQIFAQTVVFSDNFNSSVPQSLSSYNPGYNLVAGPGYGIVYNGSFTDPNQSQYIYTGLGSIQNPCSSITGTTSSTGFIVPELSVEGHDIVTGAIGYIIYGNQYYDISKRNHLAFYGQNIGPDIDLGPLNIDLSIPHTYTVCSIYDNATTANHLTFSIDNNVIDQRDYYSYYYSPILSYAAFWLYYGGSITNFTIESNQPNQPPQVNPINVSQNPVAVNTQITATATFSDPNISDTHTAVAEWNDNTSPTACTISENNGSGTATCVRPSGYTTAGIYTPKITVTDNHGASGDSPAYQYLAVYNPTPQGLFSGARIFTSPQGAYMANPNLSGQVKFGVTSKYDNNGSVIGSVSMYFKQANLQFDSTTLTALVTSNGKATLRGTGTINGVGNYNVLVTGIDLANTIRFKITDASNNVIYDSQPGAEDTADPTAAVTGHITVH